MLKLLAGSGLEKRAKRMRIVHVYIVILTHSRTAYEHIYTQKYNHHCVQSYTYTPAAFKWVSNGLKTREVKQAINWVARVCERVQEKTDDIVFE